MSHREGVLNSDSFSLNDDGQDNSQRSAQKIAELKEQLRIANNSLREQQEEYRGQLLHIETISMMTKYQLVFIKMESALIKVAHIIKTKESTNVSQAFLKIIQHARTVQALRKYKTQLIYYNLKDNTQKLANALDKLHRGSLLKGFKAIWFTSRMWKSERVFKEEKEKYIQSFNEALSVKDKELSQSYKKGEELNNLVVSYKGKENDLLSKLRHVEKQKAALEMEKSEILKSKKGGSGDTTAISFRALEERVRELQQENDDLKDKLSSAESNVGTFIREMSELLDSHELSMNIGSDENASFHNADIEEEFDSSAKVKDKGSQNRGAKENQGKALPQRAAYQSSQNRYQKVHHISYCFIQYDDPEICRQLRLPYVYNKDANNQNIDELINLSEQVDSNQPNPLLK